MMGHDRFRRSVSPGSTSSGEHELSSVSPGLLQELFRVSPVGLALLNGSLQWVDANRQLCDLLGLERRSVLSMNVRQVMRRFMLPGAFEGARRLRAGERGPMMFDGRLIRDGGEMLDVEVEARLIQDPASGQDAILATVKDLTIQSEALRAARNSASFLRRVIDLIPHFVFAKDDQGRFLLANRALAEAYGTTTIHLLGKTDRHFSATDDESDRFRADDLEVIRGGVPKTIDEEPITDASGKVRLLRTTKVPFVFGQSGVPGVLGVAFDITDLRDAEAELCSRTEELELFFSIALELLCVADTDGFFRRVNREWERTLGYSLRELEGRSFLDLVHPEDLDPTLLAVADLRQQRQVRDFVNRFRCRDGSYRFIEWRSVPVGNRIFAAARDVTEQRAAEQALQSNREMLRNVLDHFPGMVFWKDARSVYLGCNRTFALGAGLNSPEEIAGKTDLDLPWTDTEAERFRRDDQDIVQRGRARLGIEELLHLADGRVVWLNTNKIPLRNASGSVVGLLGVAADITEMRQLEEQYRQAQKMEAIGQLAGGVAHDFNNLLQIISGYLEFAQLRISEGRNPLNELDEVGKAADRASTLVRQLLTFSRRQAMQPKSLDINELIVGLTKMLRRLIEELVGLRTALHTPIPKVLADPGQLEQVIVNLCVNARDAMPGGGLILLKTEVKRLHREDVTRFPNAVPGSYVVVSVSDTGHGIPLHLRERIFDPFFTTKDVGKGTGLGLATAYGIVSQHGGFIDVESAEGEGATFRVYLPAAEPQTPLPSSQVRESGEANGRGETILVAEDEEQVRNLTAQVLREAGYQVVTAGDGREALELLETFGDEISAFVLDAVMPGVSGWELRDAILQHRPDASVVLCTGYSSDVSGCPDATGGGPALLRKPYQAQELLRMVRELLLKA